MQTITQMIGLQSLESIIDCLPPMVVSQKLLLDAMCMMGYPYALLIARSKTIFVFYSQVLGCFIKDDMVLLVASGTSFKTTNIFEVMHNYP